MNNRNSAETYESVLTRAKQNGFIKTNSYEDVLARAKKNGYISDSFHTKQPVTVTKSQDKQRIWQQSNFYKGETKKIFATEPVKEKGDKPDENQVKENKRIDISSLSVSPKAIGGEIKGKTSDEIVYFDKKGDVYVSDKYKNTEITADMDPETAKLLAIGKANEEKRWIESGNKEGTAKAASNAKYYDEIAKYIEGGVSVERALELANQNGFKKFARNTLGVLDTATSGTKEVLDSIINFTDEADIALKHKLYDPLADAAKDFLFRGNKEEAKNKEIIWKPSELLDNLYNDVKDRYNTANANYEKAMSEHIEEQQATSTPNPYNNFGRGEEGIYDPELSINHSALGRMVTDASYQFGRMIPSIIAATATGGAATVAGATSTAAKVLGSVASSGTMFTNVYTNAKANAINSGADLKTSESYAFLSASIEVGVENLFSGVGGFGSGILDDMGVSIYKNVQNPIARGIYKSAVTMGGESLEEMSANILDVGAQKITYNPKATVDVGDVLYAGALGALMSTPGSFTSGYSEYTITKSTNNTINDIIELAGKASTPTEASAAITFLDSSADAALNVAKDIASLSKSEAAAKYGVSEEDIDRLRADAEIMYEELARASQAMSDNWQDIIAQNENHEATDTPGKKGENLEDSNIVLEQDEMNYPYNQQEVIDGYEDAVDEKVVNYINKIRSMIDPDAINKQKHEVADISERFREDVKRLTNINFNGDKYVLRGGSVNHIDNRHGKNGEADHSMANDNDFGRIGWVLENYDTIDIVQDEDGNPVFDSENRNSDGSPSPVVKISKKINGTYFVVEAVPVSSANSAFIKSAYISNNSINNESDGMLNMSDQDPQLTSQTPNRNNDPASREAQTRWTHADTINSIPQTSESVKGSNVGETLIISALEDTPKDNFGKITPAQIDALRKVSRALGVNIILENGAEGYDGYYDASTRTIHINANSVKPIDTVVRHEIIHLMKREAPKEFLVFRDFIKQKYVEQYGQAALDAYVQNKKDQYKQNANRDISDDVAYEELCADIGMDMLSTASHVREFVIKHKNPARKLYEYTKRVIHTLGRVFGIDNIANYSVYEAYIELAKATSADPSIEVDERAIVQRTYDVGFTEDTDALFASLPGGLSLKNFAEGSRLLGLALDSLENANRNVQGKHRDIANSHMTLDEKKAAYSKVLDNSLKAEMDERGGESFSFGTSNITANDISALRLIGRKSVNEFTSEDIKKAEPFARKAWKELGTKSPFFRAWFGDWRANDDTLLSVPKINSTAVISSGKEFNRDMNRTISWSKDAAKESILNAPNDVKNEIAVIGANMSEIVRTAVLLDTCISNNTSKRKMDGSAFMHSLYTIVPIDNKKILIKLFAEEALSNDESTVFTRAYSLKYIKKVAEIDNGVLSENGGLTDSHPATINSISDLFKLVKQYDSEFKPKPASKVVNEDGSPKVMYHGTNADENFTVFDTFGSNFGLFGIGAYFTDNRDVANSYTKKGKGNNPRVYEAYLKADNLIDMDTVADKEKWIAAVSDEDKSDFERYIKDNAISTNEDVFNCLKELCEDNDMYREDAIEYITSVFMNMGYDGITHIGGGRYGKDNGVRHKVVIVFEPTQIKSATDNIGTFDSDNPDILYSFSKVDNTIDPATTEDIFSVSDETVQKFSEQIDRWLSGKMKSSDLFEIGNTPEVLKALGASNLPVVMSQDVMAKITGEKHSISLDEIKQLPYAIADPIMVFKSATVDNAYVILTELIDKAGNDVVVAMHLNRMSGFNKINRISSVYGKYNINNFVSSQINAGNLKYADIKKSQGWLRSRGLQLPKLNTILSSTDSILHKEDIVNRYYAQNAKKYANDSKENDTLFSFSKVDNTIDPQYNISDTDSAPISIDDEICVIPKQTIVFSASYRSLIKNYTFKTLFEAGKQGDVTSAKKLAKLFITDKFINEFNSKYKNVTIIPVIGKNGTTKNIVPKYAAQYVADLTGNEYFDGIFKTTKNELKKKSSQARLSSQLEFAFRNKGVQNIAGKHFVIFDDCITTGTTSTALRDFIEAHGGIVDGYASLAKGIDHSDNMAITEEQLDELIKLTSKDNKHKLSRLTARHAKALLKDEKLRNKLYGDNKAENQSDLVPDSNDNLYSFNGPYTSAEEASSNVDIVDDLQYNVNAEILENHTQATYDRYGWATVNNVLSEGESKDFFSKFAQAKTGTKFIKTRDGFFIIPVGKQHGVNNVLVYAKGTISNPFIEKIIKIDLDNETEIHLVREAIYESESGTSYMESENVIRFIQERQIADVSQFSRKDFRSFSELRSYKEFRSGRGAPREENIRDLNNRNKRIENNGTSGENTIRDGSGIQTIQSTGELNYSFSDGYDIPSRDDSGNQVSRSVRTILESDTTPDTFVPGVLREIREGRLSYEIITDENAEKRAKQYIKERGYVDVLKNIVAQSERGSMLDKYEIAILQTLLNQSAEHVEFLSTTDRDGVTYIDKLLGALVSSSRTAGQNLQAQKLIKKMSPLGMNLDIKRLVDDLNREIDTQLGDFVEEKNKRIIDSKQGAKSADTSHRYHKKQKPLVIDADLQSQLLKAETIDQAMKIRDMILEDLGSQVLGTVTDKLRAFRYWAMLSNPRTHVRNMVGNGINAMQIEMSNLASAVMQKVFIRDPRLRTKTIIGLNGKKRADYNDMRLYAGGLFEKYIDFVRGESNRYDEPTVNAFERGRHSFNSKAGRFFEKIGPEFNSQMLEREDMLFLRGRFIREFANAAIARGYKLSDIESGKVSQSEIEALIELSAKQAQEATFREASWLATKLNELEKKNALSGLLVGAVVPFKKTPINILKTGMSYSPFGIISFCGKLAGQTYQKATGKRTSFDAVDLISTASKGLVGSGWFLLGAFLSSLGLLSGGDEDDDKLQTLKEARGEQNYAITVGDYTLTLDWLTPVNMPLFAGVAFMESLSEDGLGFGDIVPVLSDTINPVLEASMLSGVLDVLDSLSNAESDSERVASLMMSVISSRALQYFPSILAATARTIDEVESRTSVSDPGDQQAFERIFRQAVNKLPILRSLINKPYTDRFGGYNEKRSAGEYLSSLLQNFIIPGYISTVSDTETTEHLMDIYDKTGRTDAIPSYVKSFAVNGETRRLSHDELYEYQVRRGELWEEVVSRLMKSKNYTSLDSQTQAELMSKLRELIEKICKYETDSGYNITSKSERAVAVNGGKVEDILAWLAAKLQSME